MALNKQPVSISFTSGVNNKIDPNQLPIGQFDNLTNIVFTQDGRADKRNGFPLITSLPNDEQTNLRTLNDNLVATGSNLYAYNPQLDAWGNKGTVQPVQMSVEPLVRVSTSQTSPDIAVSPNGLVCTVYVDSGSAYYQITDSETANQVVARTALPATATNPRVFLLGQNFIITFMATVSASTHLRYIAVPYLNPSAATSATDIATNANSLTVGYDGVVANSNLYLAWGATSSTVRAAYLTGNTLTVSAQVSIASSAADLMAVVADTSGPTAVIWLAFWTSSGNNAFAAAYNAALVNLTAKTQILSSTVITNITGRATGGVLTAIYEVSNTYNYSSTRSDYVASVTINQAASVGTPGTILRSVGLASKAFVGTNNTPYVMVAYNGANQPTYFLIDLSGNVIMRLAYGNGGGYAASQVLPSITEVDGTYFVPYLIKDFLTSVNKNTDLPAGTPTNAIYTQTGVNLAMFTINNSEQYSSEIAGCLHLTGGQLWQYDGVKPVEHGFQLYPEDITSSVATSPSGSVGAGTYYYSFTYEWTDGTGRLHRSAPSIPLKTTVASPSSRVTLNVPTLRLTYKVAPNPVRIVGYRWSSNQQTYYQFTSITSPTVNDLTVDSVVIVDTLSDAQILGNTLLYTTGGVVENIAPPAFRHICLYKNRMFGISAEDDTIWYSKPVVQGTPVEFSDLFTIYVAPTTGAQGPTGQIKALGATDDKLVPFKKDATYYITGNGPDLAGANNDFSEPIFITGSVGTDNPSSIVLMPSGLMFQSDKGIWLLGRDLSTSFIGDRVNSFQDVPVVSSTAIPGTNEVRFVLDTSITLVYDYYYDRWGYFSNIQAISACLYQGAQTYLNVRGEVYQQQAGVYTDGSKPVLMTMKPGWINLAGIQGYERLYFIYLLGTYKTPFKLKVDIAYDYNESPLQSIIVTPDNYTPNWGEEVNWGAGQAWGGPGNSFQCRLFPQLQKCQAFKITITELYDPSLGVAPGEGLTLSNINMVIGTKKGYRVQKASQSFG